MTGSRRSKCHTIIHTAAYAAISGEIAQLPSSDAIPITAPITAAHMNFGYYVIAVLIGVVLVAFIFYKLSKKKEFKIDEEKVLTHCFGEIVYSRTFTMSEARDWIKARKNLLEDNGKAVIAKVNNKTLKTLGQELELDLDKSKGGKYILIAIIQDGEDELKDSLLVKYENLNANLEDALAKGDGVLVIEA